MDARDSYALVEALYPATIAAGRLEMQHFKTDVRIETKADKVQKKAITKLFRDGGDVWAAMKLKEFYVLQEAVIDHCEEAAKTIEEILIENS